MKKLFAIIISAFIIFGTISAPVHAGGDKNQHEHGSDTGPGPGDDAQGNQVGGD